ncbi:NUDIX domain-containing protein [Trujillonella endophytica]|uniref:8-oxo-dGTP diphosphatase n=1 Tax=Trujillonella endophytica TaxID=673521 RepID=A0A1H8SDL1_9ACTN|nr:NUDIX domain-containing protein [Trujillella endophytica]SEO76647.1 8-oxo-dGTP diphosphatase [Trujillella endophytica]
MPHLRFTTLVEAPLTVAFDVARALGRPWGAPLEEVASERPYRDVYSGGRRGPTHTRSFSATGAGTLVEERVEWTPALPGPPGRVVDRLLVRRPLVRAMRAHLDAYAAAAARRALDVVQVVGVALVDGDRVLVAQRADGPFAGCWEFPGGKVEPGEADLEALVRECREELGVEVAPQAFLGEVPLDGVVGGGAPGVSTLRVWWGRVAAGEVTPHEHTELRWVVAADLGALDWIPADRPLLPDVVRVLDPASGRPANDEGGAGSSPHPPRAGG